MLKMINKTSSEKLMDMLDIKIKMSPENAMELAREGRLPNNVEVEGHLFFAIFLGYPEFISLPAGLKVGGSLILRTIPITSLPEGLSVGQDLDLRHTEITSLPDDLVVKGDVYTSVKLKGKKPKGVKGMRRWVRL